MIVYFRKKCLPHTFLRFHNFSLFSIKKAYLIAYGSQVHDTCDMVARVGTPLESVVAAVVGGGMAATKGGGAAAVIIIK